MNFFHLLDLINTLYKFSPDFFGHPVHLMYNVALYDQHSLPIIFIFQNYCERDYMNKNISQSPFQLIIQLTILAKILQK